MKINVPVLPAVLVLSVFAACSSIGERQAGQSGTLDREVAESSALIRTSSNENLFWTLNDSGNAAEIFAVDLAGRVRARVEIEAVENIDWEAMTIDDAGNLYIADIGNNENRRQDLAIHVISEPLPTRDGSASVIRTIPFAFPDQTAFPDPMRMNFDAEAIFWWKGKLYVISKHRSDARGALYELDPETGEVERIDEAEMGSMVTDAAVSPSGILAVLTYGGITFYDVSRSVDFGNKTGQISFVLEVSKQSEAIAWSGDSIVFTNEQRDVHYLPDVLDSGMNLYPPPSR